MKEVRKAILTIKSAKDMDEATKKSIARWLRRQADFLVKHNKEMSDRYIARYYTYED